MKRKTTEKLIAWKNAANRKPLVINGARQVGKTWLVLDFGEQHFEDVAHIVFLENEEMQRAFSGSLDANRLLTIIGAATGTNPSSGSTLIFFDEIQECPRAITALKLLCEQRPDVPVVAAGSLLGVALNRSSDEAESPASWPVGKVEYLSLYPMTFEEYVAAVENEALAEIVQSGDYAMIDALSERLNDLLKTYFYVGGMPEVVKTYAASKDFTRVREIRNSLLLGYERDFAKHARSGLEIERIRQTWKSVPVQLAKESDMKRFAYASIRTKARGRDYRDAISWLIDAGLVVKVPRITKPGLPLTGYVDETYFKLYMLDIGLLGAMTNMSPQTIIQDSRLFTEYKGAYAEQYICQQFVAAGYTPFYWSADGKQFKGELDFVIEHEGGLLPIEVKAGENLSGGSAAAFVKRYDTVDSAVRFSQLGYKDQGWLVNIPLCAADFFISQL